MASHDIDGYDSWAEGVNTRVLRNGTSWQNICGFIEDETRSGKRKRRLYASQTKRQFSVKMNFNIEEYEIFNSWYENTLKYGLYPFAFPEIDGSADSGYRLYRFTSEGYPKYSNPSGNRIECIMQWEEQ